MEVSSPEFVLGIIGSGVVTAWATHYFTKKNKNAEAALTDANSAKVFVDIAKELTLKMAEDNRRTQEELTSVYNELETAKQTIVDLQTRVEQRTRENNNCMELVTQLQKQIDERDAPKRGREPNEGNR